MPGNEPVIDTVLFSDECSSGNSAENMVQFVNRFVLKSDFRNFPWDFNFLLKQ